MYRLGDNAPKSYAVHRRLTVVLGDESEFEGENPTGEVFASAPTVPGGDAGCLSSRHRGFPRDAALLQCAV